LIQDLAVLVVEQGEMLDSIEISINETKDYVEKGEKHLIEGKELHQASRKVRAVIKKKEIDRNTYVSLAAF